MDVTTIIQEALSNSYSYTEYRALVAKHVENNSNTGAEVTEALANYTQLNHQRLKRGDKTNKLTPEQIAILEGKHENLHFIVITESWCGDAAQTMPMINKVAEASGATLSVVLRDDNLALMDQFLTNGARSIAKLVIVEKATLTPVTTWGPRPKAAATKVKQEKESKGVLSPEFKTELQLWYNKDRGKSTAQDIVALLQGADV